MALYRYNARDRENRKYKGVKEAGSEAELVKALLEDGLYCCSLKNEERTAARSVPCWRQVFLRRRS